MEAIILAYLILGIISILALLIFIIKIAGQDILFALYRYFQPRGCDIFITNSNRHIDRYYQVAKEGTFRIDNQTYLTNPNKLEGLSDEMKREVQDKLSLKKKHLEKNITRWKEKKDILIKKIKSIENKPENIPLLDSYNLQLTHINESIDTLKSKLKSREQSYFIQRRACYLYIEGDPVPKDLWEWRTEIDTVQLDNIILRAQTKDPKGPDMLRGDIVFIKKFIIFACIGIAVAIFMSIKNGSYIQQIGTHLGVAFKFG